MYFVAMNIVVQVDTIIPALAMKELQKIIYDRFE